MGLFKVTACWYETVTIEAEDEDTAIEKAFRELTAEFRVSRGYPDDWETVRLDDDLEGDNEQDRTTSNQNYTGAETATPATC
jgi:hypothetical protein